MEDLGPKVPVENDREILSFEDIAPLQAGEPETVSMLSKYAQGWGVVDMKDAVTNLLELKQMPLKLTESQDPNGTTGYTLDHSLEVTIDNALPTLKMLISGALISTCLTFNKSFKVPWGVSLVDDGPFGSHWENGYLHFERGTILPNFYSSVVEKYLVEAKKIQDWYILQVQALTIQLEKAGEE